MKLMNKPLLVHLLLFCATQALGIRIESAQGNNESVIATELNETVSLVCRHESSLDPLAGEELVWLRNGAVVRLKEGNKKGKSSVCITPIIYEDNGATFTCHLSKDSSASASVTLNVTYGPQLSGSENVLVEEEAAILLQCEIQANPPVSSVIWMLNGSRVDLQAGGFTVTNDGFTSRLSVQKAEKSVHEGTYQCSAHSPSYGEHTKLFFVTLKEKTIKFPLNAMIAGLVVVGLTALLAIVARWHKITKCCK